MCRGEIKEETKQALLEWAKRLGEIAAVEAYGEEGPELNVTLSQMEDLTVDLQQAFAKGMYEALTSRQAKRLSETAPCPGCGRECRVEFPPEGKGGRRIQTRSGSFELVEPRAHCRHCRRSFFPSTAGVGD